MYLNFDQYTKVTSGYLIMPSPGDKLKKYTGIYDRFCGVIYLLGKVGGDSDKFILSTEAKDTLHVRAALCEFVSIEDYVKESYPDLPLNEYRINKLDNPIFHFIKLLRNYNIHVSSSTLDEKSMMVTTPKNKREAFEIQVEYISNLSMIELRRLRRIDNYTNEQLTQMIDCFDNEQHEFGISTLIMKAALEYSKLIESMLYFHNCKPNITSKCL